MWQKTARWCQPAVKLPFLFCRRCVIKCHCIDVVPCVRARSAVEWSSISFIFQLFGRWKVFRLKWRSVSHKCDWSSVQGGLQTHAATIQKDRGVPFLNFTMTEQHFYWNPKSYAIPPPPPQAARAWPVKAELNSQAGILAEVVNKCCPSKGS